MNFLKSWVNRLEDKLLGLLGLCKKAGKITAGADLSEKDIRARKSELIIIAEDISQTGKKAITDICTHYGVGYITFSTMRKLADAVGSESNRTVLSVKDRGFADAILKKYALLQLERNGE